MLDGNVVDRHAESIEELTTVEFEASAIPGRKCWRKRYKEEEYNEEEYNEEEYNEEK